MGLKNTLIGIRRALWMLPGNEGRRRSPSSDPCTVLAIDDDVEFLRYLQALLPRSGFNLLTATSTTSGLGILRYEGRAVRAVLLDYNMPRLNGAETMVWIRKLSPWTKILGLTGVPNEQLPERFRTGVDRLLFKPLLSAGVVDALMDVL